MTGETIGSEATISVTLKNGDEWGSNPNSCLINVVPESVEILNKEEIQRTLIPVMEEEYKIIAKVTPENSVADTVEWTVSDWNMCSIHSTYEFIDGKRTPVAYVRCKKMGKFTITCSLIFNSKVKDVVEIDNTVRNVTIESLDPNHPIVEEGGKKYIDCTIDDKEIPLTAKMDVGMDDLKAYWSSASWNDCAVVYGHMGAFVTPKTVGSETAITVTEGICNTTDTVYIRVVNSDSIKILLGGEEVNDVVQIKKGQEVNFTAQSFRGTDLNGGNELVTWSTDAPWNNARIVSNQAGGCWITGKKVGGVYTLTCKSKTNPNLTKQIQFEVVK